METYLRVSWRLVKTSYHFLWSASCSSGINAFKKFGNLLLIGWRTMTGGSEFSSMAYLNIYNEFSLTYIISIVCLSVLVTLEPDYGFVNSKNNQIWQDLRDKGSVGWILPQNMWDNAKNFSYFTTLEGHSLWLTLYFHYPFRLIWYKI